MNQTSSEPEPPKMRALIDGAVRTAIAAMDELPERERAPIIQRTVIEAVRFTVSSVLAGDPRAEHVQARRALYAAIGFAAEWVLEADFSPTTATVANQHAAQLVVAAAADLDDAPGALGRALLCALDFRSHEQIARALGAAADLVDVGTLEPISRFVELLDGEIGRLAEAHRLEKRRRKIESGGPGTSAAL